MKKLWKLSLILALFSASVYMAGCSKSASRPAPSIVGIWTLSKVLTITHPGTNVADTGTSTYRGYTLDYTADSQYISTGPQGQVDSGRYERIDSRVHQVSAVLYQSSSWSKIQTLTDHTMVFYNTGYGVESGAISETFAIYTR